MAADPVIPTSELHFETANAPSEITFRFFGRLISSTSPTFRDAVRSVIAEKKTIILDFSNVSYIDSSGLGVLVSVWVSAKKAGSELKPINMTSAVKELFRLTNVDKLFAASQFPDTPRQ